VKGRRNIYQANGSEKKAGVAVLISDKIGFKNKDCDKRKEGHYKMIKGTIQQEDITITNIYAPNMGAPKYTEQLLTDIKEEIDRNTVTVGDKHPTYINGWIIQTKKIQQGKSGFE